MHLQKRFFSFYADLPTQWMKTKIIYFLKKMFSVIVHDLLKQHYVVK